MKFVILPVLHFIMVKTANQSSFIGSSPNFNATFKGDAFFLNVRSYKLFEFISKHLIEILTLLVYSSYAAFIELDEYTLNEVVEKVEFQIQALNAMPENDESKQVVKVDTVKYRKTL